MSDEERAFAFFGAAVLLRTTGETLRLPTVSELMEVFGEAGLEQARVPAAIRATHGPSGAFAFDEAHPVPDGFRIDGLRVAWHTLEEADFRAAGTARQKVEWYRTHRFCSRCGAATVMDAQHESMTCPACGQLHFPRVAPAVIVLVQRGREALLGRSGSRQCRQAGHSQDISCDRDQESGAGGDLEIPYRHDKILRPAQQVWVVG